MTDILVFGAHPDDAEFGMGASILKFIDQGKSICICVLSRGQSGSHGSTEERVQEMREAATTMQVSLEVLDLVDCRIFDTYENRLSLARIIRKHKPQVVFAPYHTNSGYHRDGAAHPDHTATGVLARNAARYARLAGISELDGEPWSANHIIYYIVPQYMRPNFMIDVSDFMQAWERIAECYQSQTQLREGQMIAHLRKYRQAFGLLVGVSHAEGFLIEEPVLFDIGLFLGS